jgi:hypothetical protein
MVEVCNAELHLKASDGDGVAKLRCQLVAGHTGAHFRRWQREGEPAEIEWNWDDREGDSEP